MKEIKDEKGNSSHSLRDGIIDTVVESPVMRAHLKESKLMKGNLIQMIKDAPVSLSVKEQCLADLSETDSVDRNDLEEIYGLTPYFIEDPEGESATLNLKELREAIDALKLKPGEAFNVIAAWYDDDILDEKTYGSALFGNLEAALDYTYFDLHYDGSPEEKYGDEEVKDFNCWYVIEKWVPEESGIWSNPYTYYVMYDEICYYDKNEYDPEYRYWTGGGDHWGAPSGMNLNVPTPFKAGDIVSVDCRPFTPVVHALIVEPEHMSDCCFPQALYVDVNGDYQVSAVKHNHFWDPFQPMLSPLYRINYYDGPLDEKEEIFMELASYLDGDADKGARFWNYDYGVEGHEKGLTRERILEFIKEDSRIDAETSLSREKEEDHEDENK